MIDTLVTDAIINKMIFSGKSKLVICGPGASGKDTLANEFSKLGYKKAVFDTDRPIRNLERNGVDYNFITLKHFNYFNYVLIEKFEINNDITWTYGLKDYEYFNSNLLILTPNHIKKLNRDDLFIVYLDVSEDVRRQRLNSREFNDTERRLKTDRELFLDFNDYDFKLSN